MSTTGATLIFRGRLGSDPQIRTTKNGEPVANFNLAIDQGYGERKTTAWVRVSVFGKQAEATQHLSKGDLVSVQSDFFRVATWKAQDCEFQRNTRISENSNVSREKVQQFAFPPTEETEE